MQTVEMKIKLLDPLCLPYKKYESDSGMDLKARIPKLVSLGQHSTLLVPTGVCIQLPEGYEALVRPRSSLNKIGILATLGTIDNEYRGEISIVLVNTTDRPFHINPYDRLAQLVIQQSIIPTLHIVNELDNTERGDGGFGSTGRSGT